MKKLSFFILLGISYLQSLNAVIVFSEEGKKHNVTFKNGIQFELPTHLNIGIFDDPEELHISSSDGASFEIDYLENTEQHHIIIHPTSPDLSPTYFELPKNIIPSLKGAEENVLIIRSNQLGNTELGIKEFDQKKRKTYSNEINNNSTKTKKIDENSTLFQSFKNMGQTFLNTVLFTPSENTSTFQRNNNNNNQTYTFKNGAKFQLPSHLCVVSYDDPERLIIYQSSGLPFGYSFMHHAHSDSFQPYAYKIIMSDKSFFELPPTVRPIISGHSLIIQPTQKSKPLTFVQPPYVEYRDYFKD